jgi:pimeloyl-ACP methyl ester carboxylesterase
MSTFVLVHGAFHGGWCWKRVADRLRAKGHDVFTPSLSGLAEHAHRLSADIGNDVHVEDVTRLMEWHDLSDVVLAGHSYGGLVVSGTAGGRARERLRHLVILDGAAPRPGESMLDLAAPPVREMFKSGVKDGLMAKPTMTAMGVVDPADAAWVEPKLTPHPFKTFETPVQFDANRLKGLKKTYIRCAGANGERPISPSAERCKSAPGEWTYKELPTGHDAMVTMPDQLAEMFMEAAR